MTDVTTKLIYGTFIQNRPDKVGEQEAEELFNHWLEVHGFQPEEQPIAPAGFEYETVKTKEDSTPSSDDLDVIALASDNATNSASMISDVMDSLPESTREALACALNDLTVPPSICTGCSTSTITSLWKKGRKSEVAHKSTKPIHTQ